jgi:uncharacterized protein
MTDALLPQYIAFDGGRRIAAGSPREVAHRAKLAQDAGLDGALLVFDMETSQPLELDLRGSVDDVLARLPENEPSAAETPATDAAPGPDRLGPGRPRLGVVAREITLLPRHWQWLSEQPGGASVTIRKLVEEARTAGVHRDRVRRAQESAYRFLSAMLGNAPGFEEATRALFAGDAERFAECAEPWPVDLREHALRLAQQVFSA